MKLLLDRCAIALAPLLAICLLAQALPAAADALTSADVQALRDDITSQSELAEADRSALLEKLEAADAALASAAEFRDRAARLRAEQAQAPQRIAEFERRLREAQTAPPDPAAGLSAADPVDQLESKFTLANAERQALLERRNDLLSSFEALPERRRQTRERIVALQSVISEAPTEQASGSADPAERVAQTLGLARKQAALAEQASLEAEIATEPARSAVNAAERAWLSYATNQADDRVNAIQTTLEQARARATEEQLETASELQEKLELDDPRVGEFAEENRRLAKQLQEVSTEIERARREGEAIDALLNGIRQDSQLMQRRLQAAGRKESLGRVMISRLDSLPETPAIQRNISRRNDLIADTSLMQIDIEEAFRDLNENRERRLVLQRELEKLTPDAQEWLRGLVDQRVQLLENNLTNLGKLLRQLLDNNELSSALITETEQFHQFLLGNLLWVRDFSFLDPALLTAQLTAVTDPQYWLALPGQLLGGYAQLNWSPVLLAAIGIAFLLRLRLRPAYSAAMSRPIRLSSSTLWNILAGLLMTAVLVLPWPLLLFVTGHYLDATPDENPFSSALSPALKYLAVALYLLLLTRLVANRSGVGRRFLKWDSRMLDQLRTELNWAGPLICLTVATNLFAFHLSMGSSGGPLGALANATGALTVIVFGLRLLRCEAFRDAAMVRLGLRVSMFIATVVLLMQSVGLLFAAEMYLVALAKSIVVLLGIKTLSDTLERWLLILRARMQRKARQNLADPDAAVADDSDATQEIPDLSEAHAKLLGMVRVVATVAALWMIWSPSLPALDLLESITLWSVTDASSADGLRNITMFDLLFSTFILVVTVLITRNLPSLSEVFMREWFNMSAGARYATSILLQYLVIAIGASMFLTTIGWEWSKVQWLVAALGVGIGFGLQEIVANFISGIIILFERPVRVGDIISAGGAEGVVKKINPRATIIETFDRKEHLIPNKELITGQVINWTLSDGAVRVIIPVGIAYGSDVRQALALLLEAAREVANVLPEPEPRASFEDFGDNALVLWLRCYVSEDRVGTWTELRTIINDKFADAGITISFPQRDVHLDTLEPLQVEVRHLADSAPAG